MKKFIILLVVLMVSLGISGCASSEPSLETNTIQAAAISEPEPVNPGIVIEKNPGPGPYSGTQFGFHGLVTVTLDVKDGKLTFITARGPDETVGVGSIPLDTMPEEMLAANSIIVDVVTNATYTSEAILIAAEKALAKAGLAPSDLK